MKKYFTVNKNREVIIYPNTKKAENITKAGKDCEYCRNSCKNHWRWEGSCQWFGIIEGFMRKF